jgi:hypothetical protein
MPQGNRSNILIASPEKALCDHIIFDAKNADFNSQQSIKEFLLDDLRIYKSATTTHSL